MHDEVEVETKDEAKEVMQDVLMNKGWQGSNSR